MIKLKLERIALIRDNEDKEDFILPISERPIRIFQGFNGPYSHFAARYTSEVVNTVFYIDDSYSVDFETPFGTEVFAPKSGIVEAVGHSKSYYEGLNYEEGVKVTPSLVTIDHGDHFTLLAHLGEIQTKIKIGYKIKQGEPIGRTGRTGWVGPSPHLHFEVYQTGNSNPKLFDLIKIENQERNVRFPRISQPFSFGDYSGNLEPKKEILSSRP